MGVPKSLAMQIPRFFLAAFLFFAILASAQADELWVRNQPFLGKTIGQGSEFKVEMRTFLKTLKLRVEDQGEFILVDGLPVAVETIDQTRFISLRDIVDAAGLRISKNPDLGTIDVRAPSTGAGSRGDWQVGESPVRRGPKKSSIHLKGEGLSILIPGSFEAQVDPKFLKNKDQDVPLISSNEGDRGVIVFYAYKSVGGTRGSAALLYFDPQTRPSDTRIGEAQIAMIKDRLSRNGGKILGKQRRSTLGGKKAYLLQYRSRGERTDHYLRYDTKRNRVYVLRLSGPTKGYQRLIPQLRHLKNKLRFS